ncbi:hypothetical protein A3A76_05940 [Candidatus Woesebacteria bacterium RIFCSPLOWO2_01_FULL_39_23]|uniref:Uncharacterized protein n=1 Tax=Candidatus Woesebacteria bacterium RIFCSPHIGHO2_01_FULL_40_22 TaxID=1802499 RepID=A0A1F7YI19_9BACT|nr:MAG: hypothetical protein A2141_02640 [Candidatus Woesebacteria bacterium RBG_16_40_11]OGM26943.1 MAG: hypothetical protein A2628_05885 [Candidatus Woesebacteria bacterium RIFCSPHIGHO2_01_FULL_40_22]OGM37350.1 MAG: hypothetical protein A3E41_04285 [Candidatus Woesebacteria bacterium RIFCSPHIGHO2_12_FULL_38_9]OGM63217.1 MAG: hypothetical protein A3A76_05940 [Candidatus Woesebacteria bacterium RIFCSPLOWO2_01_FULL_39_23]
MVDEKNIEAINPSVTPETEPEVAPELTPRDKFFARISRILRNALAGKPKAGESVEARSSKSPLKIGVFLILLIIIGLGVYAKFFMEKAGVEDISTLPPTPTYSPYQKYKPSIYADDPVVLKLEEDFNVLEAEMLTTPLTEGTLTLPVLDFEINFNK